MNEIVTNFCEVCQVKIEKDVKFHFLNNDHKLKLLDFLPGGTDLQLTQDSVICDQCLTQITDVEEFKQLQIKHEPDADFNDETIRVKEEPAVEKIKEEFDVGLIKEEVCVDTNNEMYYCHDCGCCTDTKRKLLRHIYKQHKKKVYTGRKLYQCDECDYKTSCSTNLRFHKSTHTDEKQFKCTQCNYAARRPQQLKHHMYHHTGKYPFQCNKCNYKSSSSTGWNYHKLTHTNEKPFKCTQCDYACRNSYQLQNHMYEHTGKYPYQCDECDYKCPYKYSLKSHKLSHGNKKLFQCDECNYNCSYRSSLKMHKLYHTMYTTPVGQENLRSTPV